MHLHLPGKQPPDAGRRGAIATFTAASRRRLLHKVNSIDRGATSPGSFRFVTLTYPAAFPTAAASKRHLDDLLKRFERAWGRRAILWKLEPQERGAPHYHLLVLMGSQQTLQSELEWWASSWHDIAGGGDRHHLRWHLGQLGNRPCVETVRDWDGVGRYAGKYLAKLPPRVELEDEWHHPGRFWGIRREDLLPIKLHSEPLPVVVAKLVRRQLVRWFDHQPSGRFRVEDPDRPGTVRRVWGAAAAAGFRDAGFDVRGYRRRWPSARGGASMFAPAVVVEQLLAWAWMAVGVVWEPGEVST